MSLTAIKLLPPSIPSRGFHGSRKRFTTGWNDRLVAEFNRHVKGVPVVFNNPYGPIHLANSYRAGWSAVTDMDIRRLILLNTADASEPLTGKRLFDETRQRLFGNAREARHVG